MDRREQNKQILNDTLFIIRKGYYVKGDRKVKLNITGEHITKSYVLLPEQVKEISRNLHSDNPFVMGRVGVGVTNIDSFSMAERLFDPGYEHTFTGKGIRILVLNFANPVHPGGGVRRGARAQEEDLCRRSSLLCALESPEARVYYDYNAGLSGYMGSDAMILTSEVEVIRDENYELLDKPFTVAVLTCAAPMVSRGTGGLSWTEYEDLLYHRIMMIFRIAVYYDYTHLVLGAWGCGAFGNDANLVSDLFYKAMKELKVPMQKNGTGTVKDFFRRIDFAVLDHTKDQYNYKAFLRNFENFYRDEDDWDIPDK
ncbi:MAG: TIGR02452 family protein [Clostridiales bacterium]|nr:TIGR02452 family protein [Clostridiales bacterium]